MHASTRSIFCCAVAFAFSLLPAQAQYNQLTPPDGVYKPTELEAYVNLFGKRLNLPIKSVRNALLRDGLLLVRDKRVRMQPSKWGDVLENFNFLGVKGNASVTGPENLVFKRVKNRNSDEFRARLGYPLRMKKKGRYKFFSTTVEMRTNLDSTIKGETLRIDSPLSVSIPGISAKGKIRMVAKRQTIPPLRTP